MNVAEILKRRLFISSLAFSPITKNNNPKNITDINGHNLIIVLFMLRCLFSACA